MVISLVNQKGGVGKTSIAINLAYALASEGRRTLLVDADPQGSVLQWQSIAGHHAFDVLHHPEPDLHNEMPVLAEGFRDVVVDSPPGVGDITLSTVLASNLVIVPIGPSPLDIWSAAETVELVREARKHNRKLRGRLIISKKIVNTTPGRDARAALKSYRMPIMETEICERIAYVKALIAGRAVMEYEPKSEAAAEIVNLKNEIIRK